MVIEEAPWLFGAWLKPSSQKPFGSAWAPDLLPDPEGLVFLLPSRYIQRKSEMGQLALTRLSKISLSGDSVTFRYAQGFLVPQPTGRKSYFTRKILRR